MFEQNYEYRTGIGTDIHRLVAGRNLMLGGIHIPFPAGLLGHSDGDVVLHAVIDSLIGAAAMGDIGTLFPDTDPRYTNVDSKALAAIVREDMKKRKWEIVNLDIIVHAEAPRLETFKGQMKRTIADIFGISFEAVNVKAKTNEGLGEIGSGQAIAATVVASLKRKVK